MSDFANEFTNRNGFSVEQEIRMLEADQEELAVTFASLGLSVAGMITGFGEAADAANAALFYSTGHPVLGTLSGLSALPIPVVEQALGLTVGSCLLVKVIWSCARIIKNAVVVVTKTKLAKPFFILCQKTGRFFQCVYEKGKATIKAMQYELTHNSMKPGYINLGTELKGFDSKSLIQKVVEALKKIAKWFNSQWNKLKTNSISQNTGSTTSKSLGFDTGSTNNIDPNKWYNYIEEGRKIIYKHKEGLSNSNTASIYSFNSLRNPLNK